EIRKQKHSSDGDDDSEHLMPLYFFLIDEDSDEDGECDVAFADCRGDRNGNQDHRISEGDPGEIIENAHPSDQSEMVADILENGACLPFGNNVDQADESKE